MIEHLFLPGVDLQAVDPRPRYREWLEYWLDQAEESIEHGNIASSMCLQAAMTEIVLFGEPRYDWPSVFECYLTDDMGKPLAYTERYGGRLYGFDNQWRQTPVHAIHTRAWINKLPGCQTDEEIDLGDLIEQFIQPDGWIYNPEVSPTRLTTRMKSEYHMSFAMSLEILEAAETLAGYSERFKATLASEPPTAYLSAEYFRLRSLVMLSATHQAPVSLVRVLSICRAGKGYCDFSQTTKTDDYMGSAKRTGHDEAVHSALSTLHANYIASHIDRGVQEQVNRQTDEFRRHLLEHPFDIPAFQIRDISIPFGTDVSPLEIIAASALVQQEGQESVA